MSKDSHNARSVNGSPKRRLANKKQEMARKLFSAAFAFMSLGPVGVANAQSTWLNPITGNWSTTTNWTGNSAPASSSTTQLVFSASGSQSYTTTNNIGAMTLNRITVNNTGTGTVTIAGSNAITLAGIDPQLNITGNVLFTGLFAGNGTMRKTGSGTFIHDSNNTAFTGSLIVDQGTFVNRATSVATTNFNPVSIVVNNGGTYQFGAAGVGDPNLPNSTYITVNSGGTVNWQESETFGGIDLNGGQVNLQQGSMTLAGTTAQSWTSGSIIGGAYTIGGNTAINKTTAGTVTVGGGTSITTGTGGLNILEGTISFLGSGNLGTANVTLGNAAGTTTGTFDYQGVTASRSGNFTTNLGGGVINVSTAGSILTLSGNRSGNGALTKTGVGELQLTGSLGSTGLTTVQAGTLRVNPVTASGGFSVGNGGRLAITSGAGNASFSTASLTLGGATSTLHFDLNSASAPSVPLAVVTGPNGLTSSGGTIRVTNAQPFALGNYTLIDYNGTAISSGFNLQLQGRTAGTLIYNTTNTSIDANITALSENVKWRGQNNGNWDVGSGANVGGTTNWRGATSASDTNFIQTDDAVFDDSATGNFNVNIVDNVQPFSVTVNNSANNYLFQGSGSITGNTGLTKSGTGKLTIATNNSFTGGTTVNAGTLEMGNGGATGSIVGGVTVASGATLAFNRSDNVTFANALTLGDNASIVNNGAGMTILPNAFALGTNTLNLAGAGNTVFAGAFSGTSSINKNGVGTVTFQGDSTSFTGTLNVNAGRFILQDVTGGNLDATSIVVNNGGVYQFGVAATENPDHPDTTIITVNQGGTVDWRVGENIGGLDLNGGTVLFNGVGANIGNINTIATGTQSFTSGLLDGIGANQSTFGGSRVIEKTTSGTVTVQGRVALTSVTNVREGTLVLAGTSNLGTAAINLGGATTSGTLAYGGNTATRAAAMDISAGGGSIDVTTSSANLTLSGVISGNGGLTKQGAGILTLTGANTYAGNTSVTGGSLLISNSSGSGTGTGAIFVGTGGTLGGTGSLTGAVTVNNGGTLSPGSSIESLGTGALIFNSGSNFSFELDTSTLAGDLVNVNGDLTLNGNVNLLFSELASGTVLPNSKLTLISYSGAWNSGVFSGFADDSEFSLGLNTWRINYNDSIAGINGGANSNFVTITAVPEPSSILLLGLCSGLSILRLRRRK